MKKFFGILFFCLFFFSFTFATTTYITKTENGKKYQIMKVTLDGKSKIVVGVAPNYTPAQSLKSLMENMGGTHAINGGFFCPDEVAYSRCNRGTSDLIRISNGTLYSKRGKHVWPYRAVFGFDKNGAVLPLATNNDNYYQNGAWENKNLESMFNGIMMPMLVKNGANVAIFFDEMNNDPKQGKANNKTFICSTEDTSTIYMGFVDNVTFSELADYIINVFGCYNAIQLDNGGTKAMIYNKKYVAGPGRPMRDAFIIIEGDDIGANVTPSTNSTTPTNQELQTAITWMYNQGLTIYNTLDQFLPNNTMTREEAAKFYGVFAQKIYNKTENSGKKCNFKDIKKADPTLRNNIISSCKLGIFQGYKNNFIPRQKLNNAEAITVLMRIIFGIMDEPKTMYYVNYFSKAKEIGLIENVNPNAPIKRGEAAMLIYKAFLFKQGNSLSTINTTGLQILCANSQHEEGGICVSNTKTCYENNGLGIQERNGNSRGSCILTSCDYGYTLSNGSCIPMTRSCILANGVGEQIRNSNANSWGPCRLIACNSGYMRVTNGNNEYCLQIYTRSCSITNGQGVQSGNYSCTPISSYYQNCTWVRNTHCSIISCNSGYIQSGNTCIVNIPTCTTNQHLENNICVENIKECIVTNGSGQQIRSNGTWGICTVVSCNQGYEINGNECKEINGEG